MLSKATDKDREEARIPRDYDRDMETFEKKYEAYMDKEYDKHCEKLMYDEDHALSIAAHAQRYKNGVINQDSLYQEIKKRIARIRAEAKAEAMRDDFRMDELDAVMHSVDKWLEGDALKNNPATRAADAREYALQAIESAYDRGKAEALKEAAEMADEALVEWFDPFRMYDVEKDLGEVRHKVEYAIMHGAGQKKDTCAWRFDGALWASECGLCWEFPERGPAENGVAYCPRCGKPVRDETKEGE